MTEQEIQELIVMKEELEADNARLQAQAEVQSTYIKELVKERDEAINYKYRLEYITESKYSMHDEFDRVVVKDRNGSVVGEGKDAVSAIDDAMKGE